MWFGSTGAGGLQSREVTATFHPFLFLSSPMCGGLVEVFTLLHHGVWYLSLQPSVMNCSCNFLSATGYDSSPRTFQFVSVSIQPVCLKLSPNLSSEKKITREAGEESSLELRPPGWQQSQAWSVGAAVRSGHPSIPLPPRRSACQAWGWGKVWVFGGAAVLLMSGSFNFSFWTFDQTLTFLVSL